MQKITPFLWFDNQAEEAVEFYTSVFRDAKIGTIARYGKEGPGPEGSVMTASFEIEGMEFTALNGGPLFRFNESISFVINCADQDEVDYYWERLLEGGEAQQCGWLKDRFGVSWQVVPTELMDLLNNSDPATKGRVVSAMLKMIKLDLPALRQAAEPA
ncbi:VOC family protein [Gilvimarinus sp. F26214L]|uniref:VOC family protein n=1 Tax=Gilvimarinus sp. DZF01 TaxID=3461371 RepID=UPI0040454C24